MYMTLLGMTRKKILRKFFLEQDKYENQSMFALQNKRI